MHLFDLITAAGSPGTLATSAFHGALLDGLTTMDANPRIVGLALTESEWMPQVLGAFAASAPWLPPTRIRANDRLDAARRGVFDTRPGLCGTNAHWRLELLLERELLRHAPDTNDCVLLADTRLVADLRIICRVSRRHGWKLIVLSNEALTDTMIDPATREEYIACVASCADGLWVVSRHLARYWESQGLPATRLLLSPTLVRSTAFESVTPSENPHSAAYVGNLAHREIDYLLDIAEIVRTSVSDFTLTIFGDAAAASRKRLKEAVRMRGLDQVVRIEAPVNPSQVPDVLRRAGVLLLPRSTGEFSTAGFPNKLGEYLASGRPVVSTAVGDIPRYLQDGREAVLVEPDDTAAFAAAVIKVLRDPIAAASMGAAGREYADRNLRSDRVAAELIAFAQGLDARQPEPPSSGRHSRVPVRALMPDLRLLRRDWARLRQSHMRHTL